MSKKAEFICVASFVGGIWDRQHKRLTWPAPPSFTIPTDDPDAPWCRYRLQTSSDNGSKRAVYTDVTDYDATLAAFAESIRPISAIRSGGES